MSAQRERYRAGLLLVWALLSTRSAFAENTSEALDGSPKTGDAVRLGYEGRQLFELGQYPAALERFRAAERIAHSPVFTLHEARCLKQLGRWMEARELLLLVSREQLPEDAPHPWRAANADALLELEALERELPRLSLTVFGLPESEVSVTLDGRPVRLPLNELPLDPGRHEVVAHRGRRAQRESLALAPGTRHSLVLRFDESERSRALASVARPVSPSGEKRKDPRDAWFWTAVGVGGASLAVASTTGALALANVHALDCPGSVCSGEEQSKLEQTRRLADVSTVSFVLAGTAAAAAVTILLFNSRSDAPGTRLRVGVGAASLSLRCEL